MSNYVDHLLLFHPIGASAFVKECCIVLFIYKLTSNMLVVKNVGLPAVCHSSEPCKNGSTDRDAVWNEDSGGP